MYFSDIFFFFKQKTAYEMRISDWSSDVCSSDLFAFKSVKGAWLQEGTCPRCGKKEVYCAADNPRMVKCGRIENCGWEDSVRNLLPDLFEDWSKRQPATPEDPTATADAYLSHERGLDLQGMRGAYRSEEHTSALQSLLRMSYTVSCTTKQKSPLYKFYKTT